MQSPHYHQVLTGVLPYDGIHDYRTVISRIKSGKRPLRPRNQGARQWLQRRVWDMITICWSDDPTKRWEVPVMRELFLTVGLRNANSGNWNAQNIRNRDRKFLNIEIGQQRRGRFLPRITSLFQFLQVPEPEIERLVNEMDKACSSTPSSPFQLTRAAAS